MSWAEYGRLYVRTLTNKRGEADMTLWFVTSRGNAHYIANHDPEYSRDYPTRYKDMGRIGFDKEPSGVAGSGSTINNRPATDDDVGLFIGRMVLFNRVRPSSLPLDQWMSMGLLPTEAERIRGAWSRSP